MSTTIQKHRRMHMPQLSSRRLCKGK